MYNCYKFYILLLYNPFILIKVELFKFRIFIYGKFILQPKYYS